MTPVRLIGLPSEIGKDHRGSSGNRNCERATMNACLAPEDLRFDPLRSFHQKVRGDSEHPAPSEHV
jgi:hypothetical protein